MAKNPGLPDIELLPKKKKAKGVRDQTNQSIMRRLKRIPQNNLRKEQNLFKQNALEKRRNTITQKLKENPNYYKDISAKRKKTSKTGLVSTLPDISENASIYKRFDTLVKRVNTLDDIKKLKKIIYGRNYRIKKQYEKNNPEYAKNKGIIMFPPIEDLRLVTAATFKRLHKIKDPDKLISELKSIIINTTRRKNNPKAAVEFSNREQDYLANGVSALQEALNNWGDNTLSSKLNDAFSNITVMDIHNIFGTVPSYWAISSGYYYAVADFDDFMNEIYKLIERNGVSLTSKEKNTLENKLFSNDPREHTQ